MNLTDNHIKWISDFTEDQFDDIVICYLKEIFNIVDYVKTDGTNDGGNDLRVFMNGEKLKVAFQVTIQETNIEKKLISDLKKTQRNIQEYGYQKSLFFFYSHPISEEKMNEFELLSDSTFGIRLYLIDAKRIAYAAKRSPVLLKEINKQYGLEYAEKTVLTEVDRMLYDFYSFGSSAAEIKGQIIKSFIVHKLYEKGSYTKEEIVKELCSHFNSKDVSLFNRVLAQLTQEGKISSKNEEIKLTQIESNRVDVLKEQFNYQEFEFQKELKASLKKFAVEESNVEVVIKNLRILFESSFNADKLDVLDKIGGIEVDPMSESLTSFFRFVKSISTENKARYLTRELIEACQKNDIIQKLSAGKMFTSFVDPEIIRNYLNQTERLVFLDTPVVLYSLCLYSNDVKHSNYYYNSVKDLFNLRAENRNLKFLFYRDYMSEIGYHFKEALLIIDFDKASLIDDLGGSNNVFYNFYSYLKSNDYLENNVNSFEDYLFENFGLSSSDLFKNYFKEKVNSQVKECLNSIDVEIFENPVNKDLFAICVETFEECLAEREKSRSRETIHNDSYMLSTLFKDDLSVNEPIFVTWDLVFLSARSKYHRKIPASRLWHWFTPDRLNNHLSLLNFNLNSETITRDILTVIDDKFNFYKKTQTLLDTLSRLIDIKTSAGRKYVTAIKEFKRDYIYEIDKKPQFEYKSYEDKKIYPVEEVMFSLVKHYHHNHDGYNLDDFKLVFQTESLYDDVVKYFKAELEYYMANKKESGTAVVNMDLIIKRSKELNAQSQETD